ncbi:MAG TPA: NUDIX hydrolase [Actinomycetota bacterium]|nr:NUDIX hydrolase [Actinomycetota bacterium]
MSHQHHGRKVVESRSVFKGQIFEALVERVALPDGKEVEREVVRHPGAVGVIPIDADGNILFVRQHRHAVEDDLLEIPAGKLAENEDPWLCARRELEEETGFKCGSLELLISYWSTPGFSNERVHIFTATELEKVADAPVLDGDEAIASEWLSEDEATGAIFDGRIKDGKTIIGVALLKLQEHPEDLGVEI